MNIGDTTIFFTLYFFSIFKVEIIKSIFSLFIYLSIAWTEVTAIILTSKLLLIFDSKILPVANPCEHTISIFFTFGIFFSLFLLIAAQIYNVINPTSSSLKLHWNFFSRNSQHFLTLQKSWLYADLILEIISFFVLILNFNLNTNPLIRLIKDSY